MLEVRYYNVTPEARENAVFSTENAISFSDPDMLDQKQLPYKYATQELWGWVLNGESALLGPQTQVPFWSDEITGADSGYVGAGLLGKMLLNEQRSALENPAVLTIETKPCSVPGITFVFDQQKNVWCPRVTLRWYLQGKLLQEQQAFPDKVQYLVDCPVAQFDRLELLFWETSSPGCYIKLRQLYLGHLLIFGRQELRRVSLLNEADPTLGELTVDTMVVEVQDPEKKDIKAQKGQQMELYWDAVLKANYYVESCTRQDLHQYTFTCGSVVGQLEDIFLGGIYEKMPLEQILAQIMGKHPYNIDYRLRDKTVTGYLPVCTRRQALQQVAFAVGGLVSTLGSSQLQLMLLPENINARITRGDIFMGASMETAENVSRVEAVAHSYVPVQERETLLEENLCGDALLLTFSSPHHSYEVTGGTLLEQGANYVVVAANGQVVISAGKYRHNTSLHTRTLSSAGQVRKVEEATLIGQDNVDALLDRLANVYAMSQTLRQSIVVEELSAGAYVETEDPWGNQFKGYITQVQNEFTPAGCTAKVIVAGKRKDER